jgi:hypothetical protein
MQRIRIQRQSALQNVNNLLRHLSIFIFRFHLKWDYFVAGSHSHNFIIAVGAASCREQISNMGKTQPSSKI